MSSTTTHKQLKCIATEMSKTLHLEPLDTCVKEKGEDTSLTRIQSRKYLLASIKDHHKIRRTLDHSDPRTSTQPLQDVVASQYKRWIYPEPITDLPDWLKSNWQWFDPSHAHYLFWPDRPYQDNLDILVAGCGANQAAVFAYTNPKANVTAVDVSEPSLNHHQWLKDKYNLVNLTLHHLPIEQLAKLEQQFDLVVSTGVIHHMASPETGMAAIAECLRHDGVAAIMLYARYGRFGVELMQSIFRDLGLNQDESSLFTVKEAIGLLPEDHPLRSYLTVAPDLQFDAGVVDTFLHGRDRSYTVDDCLDLITSAGLVFQNWLLQSTYEPPPPPVGGFYAEVAALPARQRWRVMERINTRNGCHFFTACRPERPMSSYVVDLATPQGLEAVPHFRYRCGFSGATIYRPDWQYPLSPLQQLVAQQINGERTLAQIMNLASQHSSATGLDTQHFNREAISLIEVLVKRDCVVLTQ